MSRLSVCALALALFIFALSACAAPSGSVMTPRRALAAGALGGRVYVTGGWNGQATQLDIVEALDPATLRVQSAPPLAVARSQHALVVANDALWVMGGWSATRGLIPEIETWKPGEAIWSVVARLPTPRREPAAALLGRRIVVAGGFDGASDAETDAYLTTVEAYDLDGGRWQSLAPLHTPRRGLTLVALDGALYAIGGYLAGDGYLAAVERYDAAHDRWTTLDWRIAPRTWAAAVTTDDVILLMGGYNREGFLSLVERIAPRTGAVCHPPTLRTPRAWLAAVALPGGVLALGGEEAGGIGNAVEWVKAECVGRRAWRVESGGGNVGRDPPKRATGRM